MRDSASKERGAVQEDDTPHCSLASTSTSIYMCTPHMYTHVKLYSTCTCSTNAASVEGWRPYHVVKRISQREISHCPWARALIWSWCSKPGASAAHMWNVIPRSAGLWLSSLQCLIECQHLPEPSLSLVFTDIHLLIKCCLNGNQLPHTAMLEVNCSCSSWSFVWHFNLMRSGPWLKG